MCVDNQVCRIHLVEVQPIDSREIRHGVIQVPYIVEIEGLVGEQSIASIVEDQHLSIGVVDRHPCSVERSWNRAGARTCDKNRLSIRVIFEHEIVSGLRVVVTLVLNRAIGIFSRFASEVNIACAVWDIDPRPISDGIICVAEISYSVLFESIDVEALLTDFGTYAWVVIVNGLLECATYCITTLVLPTSTTALEIQYHARRVGVAAPESPIRTVRALASFASIVLDPIDPVFRNPRNFA